MEIFKFFADMIRRMSEEPDWLIVHREDTPLVLADNTDKTTADGHLHYELYEDKNGNREVEISFTGLKMATLNIAKGRVQMYANVDDFYVKKVKPWKRGLRVRGIDTYEQAGQRLSFDELKGDDDDD